MEFKKYKIEEIGEVVSGGTPSTKINDYWNGNISWITPKDLSNHEEVFISKGERNISEKGLNESSAKILPKNSVLMTSRAPIGYIAIANNQVSTNQGFKSLICNENICHYLYFYYWLKSNVKNIKNNSSGSTFQEISGSSFKNLDIKLPNMENQLKISTFLFGIDKKIEINKKINNNLLNIIIKICLLKDLLNKNLLNVIIKLSIN
ncbi:MAG: restriction endonuclease subunit S [Methanobrevibacter sp.]|jgi:type I restriction enzyme S subunit|nr:restriction endonuclease subunit S [Candidatus Methanovirga basalitermitum]